MPALLTTQLPDVDQPSLGNGVEDEVAVSWDDVIDNGEYRLQIRETGATAWDSSATGFAEQTVSESSTSTTFTNREDGEEYEVRARSETEHRAGAWTAPVAIVTKFPGAANPSVASSTATSVTVSATDNADNEDGFRLEREERIEGEWRDRQVVTDRGPNAGTGSISMTDDTAAPSTEYRYRTVAYTEHASATSTWTSSVTTSGVTGVTRKRTGSRGWRVRVTHENGSIHRPTVLLDGVQPSPSVNDLPELRVPVPRDDKWTAKGFEDASVEVYRNGVRQPVDTLVDVRPQADQSVLVMEGGTELRDRATRSIDQAEVHVEGADLVSSETNYAANFDDPMSGSATTSLMQSASTTPEFQDVLLSPPANEDAWTTDGDEVVPLQACWTREGEAYDRGSPSGTLQRPFFSGDGVDDGDGNAPYLLSSGDSLEFDITPEYDVPSGELEVFIRYHAAGGSGASPPDIEVSVEGTSLGSANRAQDGANWIDSTDLGGGSSPPGITAGTTATVRIEAITDGSDGWGVDVVAPADSRYSWTLDNTVTTADDGSNYLDAPQWYPDIPVEFDDAITDLAVIAGEFQGAFTNTAGGNLLIELSNDQGSTYPVSGSNTDTISGDFPESGGSIRARVTLSSYGSAESTPGTGRQPRALTSYELSATLDDTPLIIDQDYDDSVLGILQSYADSAGAVFAVLADSDSEYRVEWTWPRQRTSSLSPELVDYDGQKTTRGRAGKAIVKGASQSVGREEWTAQHGTWTSLAYRRLTSGTVDVWDPSGDTSPEEGEDYEVDRSGGRLRALSSGSLSDGAVYAVSYQWQTQGSYESPDVSNPREVSKTLAALTSNRACGQAARRLVDVLQSPRYSATITVSTDDLGWNIIESLQIDELGFPDGVFLQVKNGESGPGRATFELGRRRSSIGDVFEDFRNRVSALEDRA